AQNVQLRLGIGMMTAGLLLGIALHRFAAGAASLVFVAPFFFVGAYGIGAAMMRTCGVTALRGRRRAEAGTEPVADRAELAALRRRGAMVTVVSALFAAVATTVLAVAAQ